MVLCLWVRWSDYKPSVIYVSMCVCVLVLVEIRGQQPDGTPAGEGKIMSGKRDGDGEQNV